MKQTITHVCIQTMARFCNVCQTWQITVANQVQRLNRSNVLCLAVLELVGDFEDVGVLGAVTMVVGLMVMFMAAMMNGNLQS